MATFSKMRFIVMRIERQRRRSNNLPIIGIGCAAAAAGCLFVAGIGFLLLLPNLPSFALQLSGFSPKGDTESIFAVTPIPPVQVNNPITPPEVVVDLGAYGSQELPAATTDYTVVTGNSDSGAPVATVSFDETALMNLCYERSEICRNTNSQYQNVRIDLRPGGAVVYADVTLPNVGVQQTAGVVLRLDATGRQFEVAGVDIGGALFDTPPGEMSSLVSDIEQTGNDILNQLSLQASGTQYTLSETRIDDTTLTLILR
jgi:hypothetical protein